MQNKILSVVASFLMVAAGPSSAFANHQPVVCSDGINFIETCWTGHDGFVPPAGSNSNWNFNSNANFNWNRVGGGTTHISNTNINGQFQSNNQQQTNNQQVVLPVNQVVNTGSGSAAGSTSGAANTGTGTGQPALASSQPALGMGGTNECPSNASCAVRTVMANLPALAISTQSATNTNVNSQTQTNSQTQSNNQQVAVPVNQVVNTGPGNASGSSSAAINNTQSQNQSQQQGQPGAGQSGGAAASSSAAAGQGAAASSAAAAGTGAAASSAAAAGGLTTIAQVKKDEPKKDDQKKGELPKQLPATGAGLGLAIAGLISAAGAGISAARRKYTEEQNLIVA